jgi:hypothetical protein
MSRLDATAVPRPSALLSALLNSAASYTCSWAQVGQLAVRGGRQLYISLAIAVLVPASLLFAALSALAQASAAAADQLDQFYVHFRRMVESELRACFLLCSREAAQRGVDLRKGALCASAQDALKDRAVRGEFNELLARRRINRGDNLGSNRWLRPSPKGNL